MDRAGLPILGKRIKLRDWLMADLEPFAHWQRPHHGWQQFDGPYYGSLDETAVEKLTSKMAERIEQNSFPSPRKRLVIADCQTNSLLGSVSWYWQSKETNWLSVGIVIFNEDYWGKGIGYEALGLWSQYLLDNMPHLMRLDLRTWSGNVGMIKLAQKLGYQEEARFRQARIVEGKFYDGIGYGVLRSEWNSRYPDDFAKSGLGVGREKR